MKALTGVGIAVLVLGILSFFVPFPKQENHGIKVGDAKIGVQTTHDEHAPMALSIVLIVAGAGMMIAGSRGNS
jgi:hypothetical protein